MIYLDTSVALAQLLEEDRIPPAGLWAKDLASSRLIAFELWNRIHARRLGKSHGAAADAILNRLVLFELTPTILARALEPFPVAVRTLDSLHLATITYLRGRGQRVELATYDARMAKAARALEIPLEKL